MSPEEVSARVREFNLKPTVQLGKVVEGPFDTNAAAWKALDLGRRRLQPAARTRQAQQKSPVGQARQEVEEGPPQGKTATEVDASQEDRRLKMNAGKAVG